jgi:hypothetical protein
VKYHHQQQASKETLLAVGHAFQPNQTKTKTKTTGCSLIIKNWQLFHSKKIGPKRK